MSKRIKRYSADAGNDYPWYLPIFSFFFYIFTGIFILWLISKYFGLSKAGKRRFWLIVIIFIIAGWLFEDYIMPDIFAKIEVDNLKDIE